MRRPRGLSDDIAANLRCSWKAQPATGVSATRPGGRMALVVNQAGRAPKHQPADYLAERSERDLAEAAGFGTREDVNQPGLLAGGEVGGQLVNTTDVDVGH